jgi:hypothetical protein
MLRRVFLQKLDDVSAVLTASILPISAQQDASLEGVVVLKSTAFAVFPERLEGNNFQLVNSDATYADIKICA